ncbi:MAG: MFS transporter [Thermomicrobiales bacterium]
MAQLIDDESGVMPGLPDGAGYALPAAYAEAVEAQPAQVASLWSHRNFLRLWGATGVSNLGTHLSALALPLIAAVALQATAFQAGLLAAVGWLPYLLFGLFAGVWVDRMRRRPLLIGSDLGRAALYTVIPISFALDRASIGLLMVVALLAGTLSVFYDVANLSYLPTLVDRSQLVQANSRMTSTSSAAQIVGPGIGGVVIRLFGAPAAVVADALSFLMSATLIWRIDAPEPAPQPRKPGSSVWSDIRGGFGIVLNSATLRALALSAATVQVSGYAFLAIYVLYMTRDLGLSAAEVGLVLATGGVGALVGALLADPLRRWIGQGPAIVLALFMFGATGMLVPLAVLFPKWALPLVVASEFLQWLAIVASEVNSVSLRQAIVPDRMAGRVNGTMRFLSLGLRPVGSLLGGVLGGTAIGLAGTLVVAEFGMLVAFLWLMASPVRTLREAEPISEIGT